MRRGEAGGLDRRGFLNWGMEGGREGCGRGQGDGRSLGTEQLAAVSAQHRDEWADRNREYFYQPFFNFLVSFFSVTFLFCYYSLFTAIPHDKRFLQYVMNIEVTSLWQCHHCPDWVYSLLSSDCILILLIQKCASFVRKELNFVNIVDTDTSDKTTLNESERAALHVVLDSCCLNALTAVIHLTESPVQMNLVMHHWSQNVSKVLRKISLWSNVFVKIHLILIV